MYWLGLDLETTGLNTETDRIIEVGAVLWDYNKKAPIRIFSELVHLISYPPITKEIEDLTGITQEILDKHSVAPNMLKIQLGNLFRIPGITHFVAHNAPFDKAFLVELFKRELENFPDTPWIDTAVDIPYPKSIQTRKLVHLAAEHGFVNPLAHRAVFDVLTMFKILTQYDAQEIMKLSSIPTIKVRADVTYANRNEASSRGYRWDAEKKWWTKNIKQNALADEIVSCPFKVLEVQNAGAPG